DVFLRALAEHRPAVVFIAYPNNPTGNLFSEEAIATIVAAAPGLVVIDEAYHAFGRKTFMARLAEFPNLVIMRTLSKLGLAGMRRRGVLVKNLHTGVPLLQHCVRLTIGTPEENRQCLAAFAEALAEG